MEGWRKKAKKRWWEGEIDRGDRERRRSRDRQRGGVNQKY